MVDTIRQPAKGERVDAESRCPAQADRDLQPAGGGGVIVRKVTRGYSLFSVGTGAPIARLRPTGKADMVQVLWWNGERWGASGPFSIATLPLDKALDHIATEPAFWIHV